MITPHPVVVMVVSLLAFVLSLTVHEFCHALTAYLLGDPTAKEQGRLSLNPLYHIDPLGFLFLIFLRIGWAKPVPFNARNFTYPRFFSVVVALAGPFSNLILAVLSLNLLQLLSGHLGSWVEFFFQILAFNNVNLALFNLIPMPPLDGSHIIRAVIPQSLENYYEQLIPYSVIVLFIILITPGFQKQFIQSVIATVNILEHNFVFF